MKKTPFLFSGDVRTDAIHLCEYVDELCADYGMVSVEVSTEAMFSVAAGMVQDFPSNLGVDKSSPFKKVASFATNFVALHPIITPLEAFGKEFKNNQNEIFAYMIAVRFLHGAILKCPSRGDVALVNKIRVSFHFWRDLVFALSDCRPSNDHFNFLSLLFESLAYQANPDACYERVI